MRIIGVLLLCSLFPLSVQSETTRLYPMVIPLRGAKDMQQLLLVAEENGQCIRPSLLLPQCF